MSYHFQKFLFLGIFVLAAIVGGKLRPGNDYFSVTDKLPKGSRAYQKAAYYPEPPVFLLSSSASQNSSSPEVVSEPEEKIIEKETSSEEIFKGIPSFTLKPKVENSNISFLKQKRGLVNPIFYRIRNSAPPKVLAEAALLADLKSGEIYFKLNPEKRWPLASISKLVSAAVAVKEIGLNEEITIAPDHFLFADNSVKKNLKVGETLKSGDLIKAMLVVSSNEAAEALASFYGRANFLAAMNNFASNLGLRSTYFNDPTGLSPANQSTPLDLLKIALDIYEKFPLIFEISRNKSMSIEILNSGELRTLLNINLFSGRDDFLGGKTGYIEEAKNNLVTIFSYEERPIFAVVLGTEDKYAETDKLISWFKGNYRRFSP